MHNSPYVYAYYADAYYDNNMHNCYCKHNSAYYSYAYYYDNHDHIMIMIMHIIMMLCAHIIMPIMMIMKIIYQIFQIFYISIIC